jgi:hypothetical protein
VLNVTGCDGCVTGQTLGRDKCDGFSPKKDLPAIGGSFFLKTKIYTKNTDSDIFRISAYFHFWAECWIYLFFITYKKNRDLTHSTLVKV